MCGSLFISVARYFGYKVVAVNKDQKYYFKNENAVKKNLDFLKLE